MNEYKTYTREELLDRIKVLEKDNENLNDEIDDLREENEDFDERLSDYEEKCCNGIINIDNFIWKMSIDGRFTPEEVDKFKYFEEEYLKYYNE